MKHSSKILTFSLISIGLSSCLKDDNIKNQQYGFINANTKKIIEIPLALGSVAIPLKNVDTTINLLEARLASQDVSSEDVTVALSLDSSVKIIENYNTIHETELEQLPTSLYSLISGYTLTIPKGSRTGNLQIKVNTSNFDLEKSYALGLYLKSVNQNGYILSGNFDTIVVKVSAKNKYDGVYTNNGYSLRAGDAVLTGFFKNSKRNLITAGANSLIYEPLWGDGKGAVGGIGGTTITVNPITNKVTMSSTANPALVNLPSYDNRYDPATKTFYLSYYWGNGPTHRAKTDTLIYSSPRP